MAWLIRLIISCMKEMVTFVAVLFIGIFAFADAFDSIERKLELTGSIEPREIPLNPNSYEKYLKGYVNTIFLSFQVAIGDFNYL